MSFYIESPKNRCHFILVFIINLLFMLFSKSCAILRGFPKKNRCHSPFQKILTNVPIKRYDVPHVVNCWKAGRSKHMLKSCWTCHSHYKFTTKKNAQYKVSYFGKFMWQMWIQNDKVFFSFFSLFVVSKWSWRGIYRYLWSLFPLPHAWYNL